MHNLITDVQKTHKCTVVGNPERGRGSLGFQPNSFKEGTQGCQKSQGSPLFPYSIAFSCDNFWTLSNKYLCFFLLLCDCSAVQNATKITPKTTVEATILSKDFGGVQSRQFKKKGLAAMFSKTLWPEKKMSFAAKVNV